MKSVALRQLMYQVNCMVERRKVKFSKPVLTDSTPKWPASRFSVGGLRHYGEWIAVCAYIHKNLKLHGYECKEFYTSEVGNKFVRALESRLCSATAGQLYQLLIAAREFEAPIEHIVLQELRPQISELRTEDLLRLPRVVTTRDPEFWGPIKEVSFHEKINKGNRKLTHAQK
uniref:Uncharacterized protein n=1 Tax=Babesia bovis TaxID=5865 RepID=A7AW40_BABBO|eukprot:XP_001608836.1 hypothetical protein [Babesia bovis T2Bo]